MKTINKCFQTLTTPALKSIINNKTTLFLIVLFLLFKQTIQSQTNFTENFFSDSTISYASLDWLENNSYTDNLDLEENSYVNNNEIVSDTNNSSLLVKNSTFREVANDDFKSIEETNNTTQLHYIIEQEFTTTLSLENIAVANQPFPNPDTDGDGVNDDIDIDDDNDGILDFFEQQCSSVPNSNNSFANSGTYNLTGDNGGLTIDITRLDNSFNMEINGTKLVTTEVQFDVFSYNSSGGQSLVRFVSDDSAYGENGIVSIWGVSGGSPNSVSLSVVINPLGEVSLYGSRTSTGPLELMYIQNGDPQFNNITLNESSNNTVVITQVPVGATYIYGGYYFSELTCLDTDTDQDGIPNRLDLDSDGDGIPDNIEAQSTTGFTVPASDNAATYTTNNGLNSSYITSNGITPIDTDGDGLPDFIDLDSDNAQTDDTTEAGLTVSNNDSDNDGLCDLEDVAAACIDIDACNYNASTTINPNNASCIYASDLNECASCSGDTDGTGYIINSDSDNDGLCNVSDTISGCTNPIACNYNSSETVNADNAACLYVDGNCQSCSGDQDGSGYLIENDINNNFICDQDEVIGCMSTWADNYNSNANLDNGSCYREGCSSTWAYNYDSLATLDNNTCYLNGCTDVLACNYSAIATQDDESCLSLTAPCEQCENGEIVDYDLDSDGVCNEDEIVGCQDETACNYNEFATDDSGDCEFPETFYNCESVCLNDSDEDGICDELEIVGCEDEIACDYDSTATDSGLCDYGEMYFDCDGNCISDSDEDGICDELEIVGCQDEIACDYDSTATDSGLCVYSEMYFDCDGNCISDIDGDGVCDEFELFGCLDVDACNYNELVTEADSSCYYEVAVALSYDYPQPLTAITEAVSPTFTWFYNDVELSYTESQIVPQVNGFYEVIVTDEIGCEGSSLMPIYTVNISELANSSISVYPNPVQNVLNIALENVSSISVELQIINTLGAEVLYKKVALNRLDNNIQLQVDDLPKGVYYLKVNQGEYSIPWMKL